MSKYQSHPQYGFLVDAGMSEKEIQLYICGELGLRNRRKQREERSASPKPVQPQRSNKNARTSELPKQFKDKEDGFKVDYLTYRAKHPHYRWESENTQLLFSLMAMVHTNKGIVEILSLGQWDQLIDDLRNKNSIFANKTNQDLYDLYLEHLIEYEFYLKGKSLQLQESVEIKKTLQKPLILRGELKVILSSNPLALEWFDQDICLFERGQENIGLGYQEMDLQVMKKYCGNQHVDIRIQNPLDYGFNARRLTNIPTEMNIGDYCDYQKVYHLPEELKRSKYYEAIKGGKIFFAVNFEPQHKELFKLLQQRLDGTFLGYKQSFDLLSYLDDEIPGCSNPQFYLKVKGCWTGGHQQNLCMCAVNINHGPDPSQWYSIPFEQVEKFRSVLKQKFKLDLYKNEGLWFEKINWFIENGFKIKRILQKKGDIVVSGPGTLHWVRAYGTALQSAWNLFPKTPAQFSTAFHRQNQNYQIKFQKSNTIPLKSLTMKYLDHQFHSMDENTLIILINQITLWKSQEEMNVNWLFENCGLGKHKKQEFLRDLQSFCQICHQQVFNYFVSSWIGKGISCLECYKAHPSLHINKEEILYTKYSDKLMVTLLENIRMNYKKCRGDLLNICSGEHIGNVPRCLRREKIEERKKKALHGSAEQAKTKDPNAMEQQVADKPKAKTGQKESIVEILKQFSQVSIQTDQLQLKCTDCKKKFKEETHSDQKSETHISPKISSGNMEAIIETPSRENSVRRNHQESKQDRYKEDTKRDNNHVPKKDFDKRRERYRSNESHSPLEDQDKYSRSRHNRQKRQQAYDGRRKQEYEYSRSNKSSHHQHDRQRTERRYPNGDNNPRRNYSNGREYPQSHKHYTQNRNNGHYKDYREDYRANRNNNNYQNYQPQPVISSHQVNQGEIDY